MQAAPNNGSFDAVAHILKGSEKQFTPEEYIGKSVIHNHLYTQQSSLIGMWYFWYPKIALINFQPGPLRFHREYFGQPDITYDNTVLTVLTQSCI